MIFLWIFIICGGWLMLISPDSFLSALLKSGEKAASLAIPLLSSYCVWLGFMQVMKDCRLTDKLSKGLIKPISRLFYTEDKETVSAIAMNISANLLGLGGAATAYGIRSAELLDREGNNYGKGMLFVLSATSLQLLPTTAISLAAAYGSGNAYSLILPTIISTAVSTLFGVLGVRVFIRR